MNRFEKLLIFALAAAFLALAGTAWSQDLLTRMKDRLPVIVDLKARGIVGENNQGYLSFLPGQNEKKDIVEAENNDRRTVYADIAKKQGTAIELVGQRRALQLAERAAPGEWFQKPGGSWQRK